MRKQRGLVAQVFDLFTKDLHIDGDLTIVEFDDGADAQRLVG
ncbi:MAG TPA: hypothetical protein VJ827_03315 [Rubrobacter sp.]|nr:hypothetical protein [Rubrobacter sp.]